MQKYNLSIMFIYILDLFWLCCMIILTSDLFYDEKLTSSYFFIFLSLCIMSHELSSKINKNFDWKLINRIIYLVFLILSYVLCLYILRDYIKIDIEHYLYYFIPITFKSIERLVNCKKQLTLLKT